MSEKLIKEEEFQEEQEELRDDDDDNINYYDDINDTTITNNNNNNTNNNNINKETNEIFYEVCFKCYTSIYGSFEIREKGDMVIVHCNRGYNIGFILREVNHEELIMNDGSIYKPKKILSHIKDGDETIKNILRSKISAEIFALSKSKLFMKGHKLAELTLPMTTEFQFDRKKLTVYLKKYEEISVCRLVRRLYDTFKMRIKVIEVESFEILQEKVQMYLDISKLNITLNDVFNSDGTLCAGPFLNLLHSQHEKRSSPKNSNNSRLPHSHYTFQNTMVQSNSLNINGVNNSTIPIGTERDRERERIGERADLGIIGSRNSINSSSTLNNSNNSSTIGSTSSSSSSSSIYLKNHRNSPTQSSSSSSSLSLTNNLMNGNSIAGVTNTAASTTTTTTNDYYRSIDQDAYWDHSNGYNDQRYLPTLQLPTKSSYTRSYPKYPIGNDLASDMAKYRTNLTTSTSSLPPSSSSSLSLNTTTSSSSTLQHNTVSYPSEQLSSHYNDISPTSTSSIENKFFFDEFHDHSNDHHIQPSYHHQQISNLQYLNQYHHHQHHPSTHSNHSNPYSSSTPTTSSSTFHHSKLPISPKSSSSTSSTNVSNSNSQYSHHSGTIHGYSQPQYQHQNQNQQYYHHFQQPNHHQHHQMSQNYNKSYNSNVPMKSYYSQLQSGYDSNQTTTQTSFSGY